MVKSATKDRKQLAAFITAVVAFCIGWFLVIAGFYSEPVGEISGSVLAVLGEAMVYAASVFGVGMYFNHRLEQLRIDTRKYIREVELEKGGGPEESEEE